MPDHEPSPSPSQRIDAKIDELGDWRGALLSRIRRLIAGAVPDVTEEWKWRGVPVWYHGGMLCTGETYRDKVKITFPRGAGLADPAGLFNAGLDGATRRAIDLYQADELDEQAFTSLVRAAAASNAASSRGRS